MKLLTTPNNKPSREVEPADIKKIVVPLIKEMHALCFQPIGRYNGGYAVAHCQVEPKDHLKFFVTNQGEAICNPKVAVSGDRFKSKEGCLTFPWKEENKVLRYRNCRASYTSVMLDEDGEPVIKEVKDERLTKILGYIFQHEIDHFNAVTIYDK